MAPPAIGRVLLLLYPIWELKEGRTIVAKCKLSGKGPLFGNSVPWSKKKTRRNWQPNIQTYTIYVPELGRKIRLKASTSAMRSVEKMGLMAYLKKNNLTLKDVT
jgi:large subunit ribosomal protein L28